ncbi:NADPH-dependent 3-keto-steroid reductase Hsd3b4 (3 beta-hydroxysteroid dehydrogenase type 4) (3 beta-hydroxysteroid dehydrogenase type IV) (3 beta-HSD IV) (Dihydrotestosterone 3-ketoreductase) [Durusdinium trenchii]|uniref:NADPH-dependent 3-keto-steroid reductase Hsd3b4 (3 beta-hydroxysteroid dehydrogenase type 4) (3 beta-hydroxysteroid dehydrogenase type IV) (3 beta-HSD IV) (Dihydrotestosterone 3-ketoreductase) n=1 Tax=Durusdinium trenchii TaxID=1381693 RepID=A0ABP0HK77_9DINO
MNKSFWVLVLLAAVAFRDWLHVKPKIDWVRAPVQSYDKCPSSTKSKTLMFGATSMLGKYIVESYIKDPSICVINYGRSKCAKCHVNVKGDLRDTRHVHRVLDNFKPDTVLTSVKPPLLGIHYKTFVELNLLSMVELIRAAKAKGVRYFVYVSSIAAAGHYEVHHGSTEADTKPFLTDFEAPYDVSKRMAEDYLLDAHEPGKFEVISVRTSGIIGGPDDPYDWYLSMFPFVPSFHTPAVVDSNFAGNIGDALYHVQQEMIKRPEVTGQIYYYTGERIPENTMAKWVAKHRGVPLLEIPFVVLEKVLELWHWARFDPNTYSILDLGRMGIIEQTFDNSKFRKTFPAFKERFTMEQAFARLFSSTGHDEL